MASWHRVFDSCRDTKLPDKRDGAKRKSDGAA